MKNDLQAVSAQQLVYDATNEQITLFKQAIEPIQLYIEQLFDVRNENVNIYISICNNWLALQTHLPNVEKPLFHKTRQNLYKSSALQMKYIETCNAIAEYLSKGIISDKQLVILAANLSLQCMNWFDQQLNTTSHIVELHTYVDEIFLLEQSDEIETIMNNQQQFLQLIYKDYDHNEDLKAAIRLAIRNTDLALYSIFM